jgi:hypothetical protein
VAELWVPVTLLSVVGAVAWGIWRVSLSQVDTRKTWREFANAHSMTLEFLPSGEMRVTGVPFGLPVKMGTRYIGANDGRQLVRELEVPLPREGISALQMKAAVSPRKVWARRDHESPHDRSLPLIWEAQGLHETQLMLLRADHHVRCRMNNLLFANPHATVVDGSVRVTSLQDFGASMKAYVELCSLLAQDIDKALDQAP